jgi:hypothetical protein
MPHDREDNATDPAKPEMLSYAGPRQAGEELPTRVRRSFKIGLLDVIVAGAIIFALVALMYPAIRRGAHPNVDVAVCSSHLRQLYAAMQQYAVVSRGVYPTHMADLAQYVGGGQSGCFVCPASIIPRSRGRTTAQVEADLRDPTKVCCSFVLVVQGMKQQGMKTNTIVLHEQVPSAHKNGVVNFVHADGGVRTLTPAEAKWAISELAAGFNPPRAIGSVPATAPSR